MLCWIVRYYMDEDFKCIKVFKILILDLKGNLVFYDRFVVLFDN